MSALQWTNGDEVVADRALDLVEDLDQGATDEEDDLDLDVHEAALMIDEDVDLTPDPYLDPDPEADHTPVVVHDLAQDKRPKNFKPNF